MYYLVKICRLWVTEYEKLTKQPENENVTEIIECSQDELVSNDNFLLYESPKKKLNATLESIGVSLGNIHAVAQIMLQMQKVNWKRF